MNKTQPSDQGHQKRHDSTENDRTYTHPNPTPPGKAAYQHVGSFFRDADDEPHADTPPPTPEGRFSEDNLRCRFMGRRYRRTAQPSGEWKIRRLRCLKCLNCIDFMMFMKSIKFRDAEPAPTLTILEFTAANPSAARDFASLKQHSRRLPGARRASLLDQDYLDEDQDGTEMPTHGRILIDGVVPEKERTNMLRHAKRKDMTNVRVLVEPVDEEKFRSYLPTRLRLHGIPDRKIDACHFGRGWSRKWKPQSLWGDGISRVATVPDDRPAKRNYTDELTRAIERSCQPWRDHEREVRRTGKEDPAEKARALPYLQRGRYAFTLYWFERASERSLEATQRCIESVLNGEKPDLQEWRLFTKIPKEPVLETASYLLGEREPEPAIFLIAEKLGFTSMWREPHIDPAFLRELTDTLPLPWPAREDERYHDERYDDDLDPPMSDEERLERDIRMAA